MYDISLPIELKYYDIYEELSLYIYHHRIYRTWFTDKYVPNKYYVPTSLARNLLQALSINKVLRMHHLFVVISTIRCNS